MADDFVDNIREQNRRHEEELATLSERVEGLRTKYDRYFMGLDKIPPERERAILERDMRNAAVRKSHKTAMKFRFTTIRSRLTTERTRWDRIMRMIEEGRFKREKNALSGIRGTPKKKAGPMPAAPTDGGMRDLYDAWRSARSEVGARSNVGYDAFRSKIEQQKSAQMNKYGWSNVDYSVKVKNGKVAMIARRASEDKPS